MDNRNYDIEQQLPEEPTDDKCSVQEQEGGVITQPKCQSLREICRIIFWIVSYYWSYL